MKLNECRILLTGATGGIGQILAEQLLAGGAQLLLVSRRASLPESLQSGQVCLVQADLGDAAGREAVMAAARVFGGVNCLINAAGVNHFGLFEEQSEENIARLVNLNLTATLQLTHQMLPLLYQQPKALILNVGSTLGTIGFPGFATYCATKFALRGFSEALRRELADSMVKVLYVAPRATRTSMNGDLVTAMNEELGAATDEPMWVARQIVRVIQRETALRYLGWPEKLFARINGLLPGMVDGSLRKQLPIIQRYARQRS